MQLTIKYREDATSYQHKDFHLICDVGFSNEELAVAQERGMWDISITLPPAERPPTGSYDRKTGCLRLFGIAFLIMGLVGSCMQSITGVTHRTDAPPYWAVVPMAVIGLISIILSYTRDEAGLKIGTEQELTIRDLVSAKSFQVHAYTLAQAKERELEVRDTLKLLADSLRSGRAIPEEETYEL